MSKRKQYNPEFKAKEALKDLHAKIGELTVERDFCPESSSHGPASEAGHD